MTELPKPTGTFKVRVTANSSSNEIIYEQGVYKVRISAPADKNKANKELIKFLSKWLGRRVYIKRGLTSREKMII
ncbi:MAG: DUF167 domain-containing protein [Nanoarchaeota archaeon]